MDDIKERNRMADRYLFNINILCKKCGYRNQMKEELDQPVDIIACGRCGSILNTSESIKDQDLDIIRKVIDEAIKGE